MKRAPVALALGLALGIVLAGAQARAADDDPWVGQDKTLHFAVSAGIAAGGYAAGVVLFDDRGAALLLGAGVAAAAGIAKETADLAGLGDPSWKDLAWDGMGLVTGLAVAWGVDLLIRGISTRHPALGGRTGIAF